MRQSAADVVQLDLLGVTGSAGIAPPTDNEMDAPLLRLRLEPLETSPLHHTKIAMMDKLAAIRRERAGQVIGRLACENVMRLDCALVVIPGLG